MSLTQEQKNKDAIQTFLDNNGINTDDAKSFKNKFETFYYVGDSRKFAEPTRIGFNIVGASDINVSLHEINDI